MTVDPVTNAPATSASTAKQTLAGNFDTFLVLLTAQLQNQDPLSPMDSTQFTQQLVQFSQVEQQIETNDKLENILTQNQAAAAQLPLGYLGHSVVMQSNRSVFGEDNPAKWTYSFEDAPETVTLTVKNADGRIVHTESGLAQAGSHAFSWDGKLNGGADAPAGVYTLTVTAKDTEGASVASTIHTVEAVSGLDLTSNSPRVLTASGVHDLSEVRGVYDN